MKQSIGYVRPLRARLNGNSRRSQSLVVGAAIWLVAMVGQAQIIYLSDTRDISVSGGINEPNYPPGTFVNYSGNYSASADPSDPFGYFNTDVTGGASLLVSNGAAQATYTTQAAAQQTSMLNPTGIYYSSNPVGPAPIFGGPQDSGNASSYLTVTFMVSAQLTYTMTAWNALGYNQNFSFSALNGNPWSNGQSNPDGSVTWMGQLEPDIVYTLSLETFTDQEFPNMELTTPGISGMLVNLAVPEPGPIWLLGIGLAGLLASKINRLQKAKVVLQKARKVQPQRRNIR